MAREFRLVDDTEGLMKTARAAGMQRITDLFTSVFFPLAKHLPTNSGGGEDPQLIDIPLRFGEGHTMRIGTLRRGNHQYMIAELQGATDAPIRVIHGMSPDAQEVSVAGFTEVKNLNRRQLAWLSRFNAKDFDQDAIRASLEEAKHAQGQLQEAEAMRKQAAKSKGLFTVALDTNKVAELEARSKSLPVWEVLVGEGNATGGKDKTKKSRGERTKPTRRKQRTEMPATVASSTQSLLVEIDSAGAEQTAVENAKTFFNKPAHDHEWQELLEQGKVNVQKLRQYRDRIPPHSWLRMSLKQREASEVQYFLKYMDNVVTGKVSYPTINDFLQRYRGVVLSVTGPSLTGQSAFLKLAVYLSGTGSQTAGAGNKDRQELLLDMLTTEYAALAEKETNEKAKRSYTKIYGWMKRAADFMHEATF